MGHNFPWHFNGQAVLLNIYLFSWKGMYRYMYSHTVCNEIWNDASDNNLTQSVHVHWASKETYHFFRAMLTKIHGIKINHIWTQISYSSPHEAHPKFKGLLLSKREKIEVKAQKVIFQKSQKLLTERAPRRQSIQSIQ